MEREITLYLEVNCLNCNKNVGKVPVFGNYFKRAADIASSLQDKHLEDNVSRDRKEMEENHMVLTFVVFPVSKDNKNVGSSGS